MAPDLNKKLEDEVEKYRQTQNGKILLFNYFVFFFFSYWKLFIKKTKLEMKKYVTQQQQLYITKTENDFVKQVGMNYLKFF